MDVPQMWFPIHQGEIKIEKSYKEYLFEQRLSTKRNARIYVRNVCCHP